MPSKISSDKLTRFQKSFVREGSKDLSDSTSIKLIFTLCRYSPVFTRAQRRGLSVVECDGKTVGADLRALWQQLKPLVTEDELTLNLR